ncbi:MAG: diaminopimelate decarboxylase family protein [Terriglobia bacterium]
MLSYRDGTLNIDQRPLKSLLEQAPTPFFLFSEAQLRANYAALAKGLSQSGGRATIRYCAKTNNEAGVLRILADCGSEVMTSHPAETQLALECGFAPEKIAFQRPVLVEDEVESVLDAGISLIHAYRLEDLELIDKVALSRDKPVRISLRVRNDSLLGRLSPLNVLSRRLGFPETGIDSAVERIVDSRRLKFFALNFYCGTQQESTAHFQSLMRAVVRLCVRMKSRFGIVPEEINFGGGVPSHSLSRVGPFKLWDRFEGWVEGSDSPQALEEFGRALCGQFIREARSAGLHPLPGVAAEPGRSIASNAGVLLTRVCALQENWVFLDASHNYLGESVLFFRRRILPLVEAAKRSRKYYHLSGNTLNTMDVVDLRRRLPTLNIGDVLCLADAGAYTISRSSRYAGLSPAVYLLELNGRMRLIRRAEEFSDLARPMIELKGREESNRV